MLSPLSFSPRVGRSEFLNTSQKDPNYQEWDWLQHERQKPWMRNMSPQSLITQMVGRSVQNKKREKGDFAKRWIFSLAILGASTAKVNTWDRQIPVYLYCFVLNAHPCKETLIRFYKKSELFIFTLMWYRKKGKDVNNTENMGSK